MKTLSFFLLITLWFPAIYSQQKKPATAVLEFQSKGSLEKIEVYTLTSRFRTLLEKTQAFNVIEGENMIEILKAKNFNISDECHATECAIKIGKLLGVGSIIIGNIGKVGDTYTLDARLINVESGGIIKSVTQDYQGKVDGLLDVLKSMADNLADNSNKITAGPNLMGTSSSSKYDKKLWYIIGGAAIVGGGVAVLWDRGSKGATRIPIMDLPPNN